MARQASWRVRPHPCESAPVALTIPPLLPLRDHLPTRTFPFVNYAIIAANIAGFAREWDVLQQGVPAERLLQAWGLVPRQLMQHPALGLEHVFTSMFMHDPTNLMHLGGNMLFLWIFGDNVEDALGHVRYILFYLLGGVAAAAAQVLAGPTSLVPMVGASGAIASVLAAYAFLYPRSPITVLNPIFFLWFFFGLFLYLPAWLVIGEWFAIQLWDALANKAEGGVAFMAHVGGFLAGALLLGPFMGGRDRMDSYARWERWAHPRTPRGDDRRRDDRSQWYS
jgi:membrane associated rhomboid family serine protease